MKRIIILLLASIAIAGYSEGSNTATTSPPEARAAQATAAGYKLVFFLDPNGGPCRMQAQILTEMANELKGRAAIHYVQTTVSEDHRLFAAYGIRALPTLLLADASGRELKRLAPGVKGQEEIRTLLRTIP
jgi:thioredoxin 1